MNNEQSQDKEQQEQREQREQREQQQEAHNRLRSERKTRGEVRNTHLEAGREQARRDNALAKERNAAGPPLKEDKSKADEADDETEREARKP